MKAENIYFGIGVIEFMILNLLILLSPKGYPEPYSWYMAIAVFIGLIFYILAFYLMSKRILHSIQQRLESLENPDEKF